MEKQSKYTITSLAQSFLIAWVAAIVGVSFYVTVILEGLVETEIINVSMGLFIYGFINALNCFFIVKPCPMSIWFVPLILNSFVIIMLFKEPELLRSYLWLPVCSGILLCIIASLIGAKLGDRDFFIPTS